MSVQTTCESCGYKYSGNRCPYCFSAFPPPDEVLGQGTPEQMTLRAWQADVEQRKENINTFTRSNRND